MNTYRIRNTIPSTLIAILVPALFIAGCNGREIESHWAGNVITIDGDMSEWPDSTRTYFKKKKALVGVSNDGKNLYLLLRFGEPAWLTAMAMGNLTVWVDTSGKRQKHLGFRYSGGMDPAAGMRTPGGRQPSGDRMPTRGDRPDQRSGGSRQMEPPELRVISGDDDSGISVSLQGADGPVARSSMLDRIYTLELKIPLSDRPDDWYGIDVEPGALVSLGFELTIDREQIPEMGQRGVSGGMRPGGMGGRGGGTGGGGVGGRGGGKIGSMGGGGMGGMTMPQEQKIWIKVVLAEPSR